MTKRQHNTGSIYFDKARKRFRASFVAPNGDRVFKRFITKEEAEEWLTIRVFNQIYTIYCVLKSYKTLYNVHGGVGEIGVLHPHCNHFYPILIIRNFLVIVGT